ncbi:MAG: oligoendopeptidase F [Acidobacteria bacterium]|jgi:oligoendopeptidase F|nr:oligoendopeptidase F [Acidobacteriota bacterium]
MKIKMKLLGFILAVYLIAPWMLTAQTDPQVKIPDYSTMDRKDIPVEYTWKIEDIYPTFADWQKDKELFLQMIERIDTFAQNWTSSAQKMLDMFEFRSELVKKQFRLFAYAHHQSNVDMGNAEFQAMKGELQAAIVKSQTKFSFMEIDILKLGKEAFTNYVNSEPRLKPYVFHCEDIFREAAHVLPAEQEQIASMSGIFGGIPGTASGMLNNVEIPNPEVTFSDGNKVILNFANFSKYRESKNREDRELATKTFWENHEKFANTLAILMSGTMKQHLFAARVHKYKDCLEAALHDDNIDPDVYHNLIKYTRANLEPFHRYWKVKKELLGLDTFKYIDVYASAVEKVDKLYPYEEAQAIIINAFQPMGKEYTDIARKAFSERWIDVYPNKGKQVGAYSGGVYGVHPFIKMNYNGSYYSVSTLAHELGHTIHTYFSNESQPFPTANYTIFLAEVASTFNENLLMQYLLKYEKDDLLKLFILDNFLQQIKGSLYRQVQFAEFELAMHREVEADRSLTPQWLNQKFLELTRFYYGHDKGVVEVDDYIQDEWATVPHFHRNYYVYTYSTGIIASMALSDMVLNGKKAEREKYLAFLKSGGSNYPLETLKLAGVDMTTPVPYQAAFKRIGELVSEMEKISARLKKKKLQEK